jgi:hypothetical protein
VLHTKAFYCPTDAQIALGWGLSTVRREHQRCSAVMRVKFEKGYGGTFLGTRALWYYRYETKLPRRNKWKQGAKHDRVFTENCTETA